MVSVAPDAARFLLVCLVVSVAADDVRFLWVRWLCVCVVFLVCCAVIVGYEQRRYFASH